MPADLDIKCMLCTAGGKTFFTGAFRRYYQCEQCSAVFLAPEFIVSKEAEKKRYLEHNNNVEDPRYQKFVEPLVAAVEQRFGTEHKGLDFGAGTGPVIAKLLRDKGYSIEMYDPFFWDDPEKLKKKYDFIVCCEVIEHFQLPAKEFKLLKSLLNPGGVLLCMTHIYAEGIDFKSWYYKNDPTHVFFYHQNTINWIKSQCGFKDATCQGRLVQFCV